MTTTQASYLDELLHADHVGLPHGERVLQAITDDDHQRQALPVKVGSGRGLSSIRNARRNVMDNAGNDEHDDGGIIDWVRLDQRGASPG